MAVLLQQRQAQPTMGRRQEYIVKIYVCPCGPGLSVWRSHNSRYGYVISTVQDGGGLDAPVWSIALPPTVASDADIAAFVAGSFTATVVREVTEVLAGKYKEPALPELHDAFGGGSTLWWVQSQLEFMARRHD